MKSLAKIFDKDPESFPESVLFQNGIDDYIEDLCSDGATSKCSEENRLNIEKILNSHQSQNKLIQSLLEFEKKNGQGSLRKSIEKNAAQIKIPKSITDLPEWKTLHH